MDLGDIVYFLILIIGVIFSVFNKKKNVQQKRKSTPPPQNTDQETATPSSVKRKIKEMLNTEQEAEKVPASRLEDTKNTLESTFSYDDALRTNDDNPIQKTSIARKNKAKKHRNNRGNPTVNQKDFDLRTAIIHDAIINRPYA